MLNTRWRNSEVHEHAGKEPPEFTVHEYGRSVVRPPDPHRLSVARSEGNLLSRRSSRSTQRRTPRYGGREHSGRGGLEQFGERPQSPLHIAGLCRPAADLGKICSGHLLCRGKTGEHDSPRAARLRFFRTPASSPGTFNPFGPKTSRSPAFGSIPVTRMPSLETSAISP